MFKEKNSKKAKFELRKIGNCPSEEQTLVYSSEILQLPQSSEANIFFDQNYSQLYLPDFKDSEIPDLDKIDIVLGNVTHDQLSDDDLSPSVVIRINFDRI